MNSLTVKVYDRSKQIRFGETLTTGSRYNVEVEGGAATCGADSALILSSPAGRQMAVAVLTNGSGTLDLNCDAMLKLEATVPFGTTLVLNAVLRCFDAGEEQNVGIGQCHVMAAWQGTENPDTGTVVYYKGPPGNSLTWEDLTEAQKDELAARAVAGITQADTILEGETMQTNTLAAMRAAIKAIGRALGATVACLALIMLPDNAEGYTVGTAQLNDMDLDSDPQVVTSVTFEGLATAEDLARATTNLDARPVPITPLSSGRGVTFVDQYGEDQNVAIEIGEGAKAAVTTNAVEAASDNKVIRSTGVAIGGHASVENSADPLKIQGVAVGWHATVTAINGVAIGSGANHPGDNDATVASAPKAIAVGYGAKASAANAVQLGEGENAEEDTLKFRDVTIVKNGKIQGSIDEDQLLADGFTKMDFSESNGVKRVTIQNDDHTFRVVTDTNRADGVALTMGDAEIYGTAAIDRKLDGKADVDYVWRNFANLQIIAWPYSSANTYNKGDYCIHDYGTTVKALCRCKVDNTTGYWYSENWDIVRLANEVVLKSIHSETPEFGKWTISQNPDYRVPMYGLYYAPIGAEYEEAGLPSADTEVWWFDMTGAREGIWTTETNSAATSVSCVMPLAFPDHTEYITLTGTRTVTYPVIAYQLGSNSDKLLQPKGDYARVGDISNVVTKAYVEGLGITSEESDPTVPGWAKASSKPSYTAAEVGAATMGDIIRVVSGTNVVLVITNYNSAVHAPSMKIQRLNPETGEFETYWDETIRHGMTLDSAKEYTDNATNNLAAVKADRAFGKYTSGFGVDAPKGVTWLSGGTTVFGAGHDFAKTVTSSGEIFTLVNSGLMLTNVECPTNSAFWQLEANGETLYRVEKASSHVVNINIHAVSVVDPYLLINLSGWIYPEHPVARVRLDLADADWLKEEDYTGGVIPGVAAITWLGSGSANDPYICQIENLSGGAKIFAGLWYEAPGATKIIANGVSDLTKGIYYNGATYLPSVSGNELKFIRAQ